MNFVMRVLSHLMRLAKTYAKGTIINAEPEIASIPPARLPANREELCAKKPSHKTSMKTVSDPMIRDSRSFIDIPLTRPQSDCHWI